MFLHFVSAATGIAAMMVVFKAMKDKVTDKLGNFWDYLVKSITRLLLPLSFIVAIILAFYGTPTSYKGKRHDNRFTGGYYPCFARACSSYDAIKQTGTNGGGWFGVNSAHPFENPNYLTNMVENSSIFLYFCCAGICLGFLS